MYFALLRLVLTYVLQGVLYFFFKLYLSDSSIVTSALLWLLFVWTIFFYPFVFSLSVFEPKVSLL